MTPDTPTDHPAPTVQWVDALRFAVGAPEGRRSSTWRFWGNKKGDFYFSTRSLGGVLKTSLHRDGRCHTGFTSEYAARSDSVAPQGRSRHQDRWLLPNAPFCVAARILIPESELREYPTRSSRKKMKWLDPPRPGGMFVVSIYVATPEARGTRWPGSDRGSIPVGVMGAAQRTCWVVGIYQRVDVSTLAMIEGERIRLSVYSRAEKAVGRRAILGGAGPENGPRWALELAWQD